MAQAVTRQLKETLNPGHMTPREMPHDSGSPYDWHRHTCEHCGCEWAHDGSKAKQMTKAEHVDAHTCPECGKSQYWCTLQDDLPDDMKVHIRAMRKLMSLVEGKL